MRSSQAGTPEAVAALIRQESRAGRLVAEAEILHRMTEQSDRSLQPEEMRILIAKSITDNDDLAGLPAGDGSRLYYSSQFMTEAYAGLLLEKQGDPLQLVAQTVRRHSADYPRPVPLDLFTQPPFSFTNEDIRGLLERMAALGEYRDIARTTTSSSREFLYSTLHLEPEHASALAEWLDVGQSENP